MTRAHIAAVAAVLVLAACAGDGGAGDDAADPTRLVPAAGPTATPAQLEAAAGVVSGRLARLGLPATARVDGDALVTSAPVDAVIREAVGRSAATELWSVGTTSVGACPAGSAGVASLPVGRRCHTLDARLADVGAFATAQAELQPGIGWTVAVFVDPARYGALRDALAGATDRPVAVVAGGQGPDRRVVGVFEAGAALGQRGRIGPGLSEREARRLAAALTVDTASPVAFTPPTFGDEPGPFPDADFWLAALSANVCGTWLPDAPTTPDASGIHSHGDGFVYAHPYDGAEAEGNATLGKWLGHGSWRATSDELALWDGAPHRTGDPCPDGRPGEVRWWVDGAAQTGPPEKHRIGNGQAITLSFNPAGVDPGPPPAAARLPLPRLTPEA